MEHKNHIYINEFRFECDGFYFIDCFVTYFLYRFFRLILVAGSILVYVQNIRNINRNEQINGTKKEKKVHVKE